jgi:hypothetical protein
MNDQDLAKYASIKVIMDKNLGVTVYPVGTTWEAAWTRMTKINGDGETKEQDGILLSHPRHGIEWVDIEDAEDVVPENVDYQDYDARKRSFHPVWYPED